MTVYRPIALGDAWGVDMNTKVTPAFLDELLVLDVADLLPGVPPGRCIEFIERYVFFGPPRPGDLDAEEAKLIASRKTKSGKPLVLVVVQHVRGTQASPTWTASGTTGQQDAVWAIRNAQAVGYVPVDGYPAPCITQDMEAVANPGQPAVDCVNGHRGTLLAAKYGPFPYEGYESGLTPAQWAAANVPVWCDFATREPPPGRGYGCKQNLCKRTVAGIAIDLDHAMFDEQGAQLVGMGMVDEDPLPHFDPSDTKDTDPPEGPDTEPGT